MTTRYFRSPSTCQDDAEHSTRREPLEAREPMALTLRDFRPVGRGNSQARNSSLHAMQRTHGNRAVQRYVHGSISSHSRASLPVQREEGGMWNYAKKLTGVDQIGSGIEKIVDTAKSGYNWAEEKVLDFLGVGGNPSGQVGTEPAYGFGGPAFFPHFEGVEGEITDDGYGYRPYVY